MKGQDECVQNTQRGHSANIPHPPENGGDPYRQNRQWEDIIEEATAKDSAREGFVRLGGWRYWWRCTSR
jgi:hypothetical protein